jgi:hypothetical protein
MDAHAPLIRAYPNKFYDVTHLALTEPCRVFAVSFALRLPAACLFTEYDYTHQVISNLSPG